MAEAAVEDEAEAVVDAGVDAAAKAVEAAAKAVEFETLVEEHRVRLNQLEEQYDELSKEAKTQWQVKTRPARSTTIALNFIIRRLPDCERRDCNSRGS